jgi:hypothetical protein
MDDAALQSYVHQWLQNKESDFFSLQKFMLLFKGGRRLLSNAWTMLKNNYTFSSVVVNFCGMFMFVTCKQHEIEDRRHYFLTITF